MSVPAPRVAAVPTLAQIVERPALVEGLPLGTLVDLQRQLRHVGVDLAAAIARQKATSPDEPDELLLIDAAAALLRISEDTLYSKWSKLPFAFKDPLDSKLKFSRKGIERWLASRMRRNAG